MQKDSFYILNKGIEMERIYMRENLEKNCCNDKLIEDIEKADRNLTDEEVDEKGITDEEINDKEEPHKELNSKDTVDEDKEGKDSAKDEVSVLQEQLIKAQEERDEYLSMAQRLQAEFDNYRKRNRSAVSEAYEVAALETVEKFLPVLDNLQRALESSKDNDSPQVQAICKGVEMVVKQFNDILEKMGIEEIDALGQPFDPMYHDAVMQVEAENEEQKNKVVEVLLKGYKTEDRVIRYSMVKVAN